MEKDEKWKKVLEVGDFLIEENEEIIRAVNNEGMIINSIKKK